ncbi:hypothetical protein COU60_04720 [Candidatus Pacearchaeota archaeon CG10_big_fil_rev_8_21_14_0_10_34_76]|nr:MAG: hypothetical protein COU60_04720 [Candidatus Pacearchaeota archaeon CG10_big_fil_rev_8_21_14_0_10_34_76]
MSGVLTNILSAMPIFRQFDPFAGGFDFRNLIYQWENIGVFDLFLPFLLVFAVVFAILSSTRVLGDHKGVNIIISLVLGLFSVRVLFVRDFFGVIFANFGIAIAGLIVLVILTGVFVTEKSRKQWVKLVFGIGVVGFVIVMISSINSFSWFGSPWWQRNWLNVLWIAIGGVLLAFMLAPKEKPGDWGPLEPLRKKLE